MTQYCPVQSLKIDKATYPKTQLLNILVSWEHGCHENHKHTLSLIFARELAKE